MPRSPLALLFLFPMKGISCPKQKLEKGEQKKGSGLRDLSPQKTPFVIESQTAKLSHIWGIYQSVLVGIVSFILIPILQEGLLHFRVYVYICCVSVASSWLCCSKSTVLPCEFAPVPTMARNLDLLVCLLIVVMDLVAGILGIQGEVAENKVCETQFNSMMDFEFLITKWGIDKLTV